MSDNSDNETLSHSESPELEVEEQEQEQEEINTPFSSKTVPLTKKERKEKEAQFDELITKALSAMKPISEYPWIETLVLTASTPTVIEDIFDKQERELVFCKQGLEAAIAGCRKMDDEGIPFRRPDDYFAEMVKDDEHMARIQRKLGVEKRRAVANETAKRQRELRKFGKQIQEQKLKEREDAKKANLDSVKEWRKKHAKGDEFPVELAEEADQREMKKKPRKRDDDGEDFQAPAKKRGKKDKKKSSGNLRFSRTLNKSMTGNMFDPSRRGGPQKGKGKISYGRRTKNAQKKRR